MEQGCLACDLAAGLQPLPGGRIFRTDRWLVEHCVGPLGVGTLIVKPQRHVTAVADLTPDEAGELGPLLCKASRVAGELVPAEQVYSCLWSHAGGVAGHIHCVIQPVGREVMDRYGLRGPNLQVAMLSTGELPDPREVERVAERARQLFERA
jgi:diadenosine tetraphosphate (Ap4A) HIT family hydrolase